MKTTMHLFLSSQALHDKLTAKLAGEEVLETSIVTQKQERANGDIHIFRVLKDRDTFDCLLCYRADEVIVHGTHCCELLPLAIAQLRPKTVKFEL